MDCGAWKHVRENVSIELLGQKPLQRLVNEIVAFDILGKPLNELNDPRFSGNCSKHLAKPWRAREPLLRLRQGLIIEALLCSFFRWHESKPQGQFLSVSSILRSLNLRFCLVLSSLLPRRSSAYVTVQVDAPIVRQADAKGLEKLVRFSEELILICKNKRSLRAIIGYQISVAAVSAHRDEVTIDVMTTNESAEATNSLPGQHGATTLRKFQLKFAVTRNLV